MTSVAAGGPSLVSRPDTGVTSTDSDDTSRRGSVRSSTSGESAATAVPRVGGVRCYWAVLRPKYPNPDVPGSKLELVFVHPDPVLGAHLAKQKMSLMGRGVIEFIHPSEREQARKDLTSAISADDLQGSVTRVRFARLSRLKIILGCAPDEIEYPEFDWRNLVEDDEYLVLDLVLNWVADGMLLAFFHAIRDTDPIANNDPKRRHEGWSNFCGTAHMGEEQVSALQQDISQIIAPPSSSRFPPNRVFQLYTPATPTTPPALIFSWPPARPPGSYARFDGLYNAEDYSHLMRDVNFNPATLPQNPGDVRTTCTTRFGAQHSLTNEGVYRLVASTFIPYGALIFACFQTVKIFELPERQDHVYPVYTQPQAQPDWQATNMEAGPSGSSDTPIYTPDPYQTPMMAHQQPPQLLYPSQNPSPSYASQTQPPTPIGPPEWPPVEGSYQPYVQPGQYPSHPGPAQPVYNAENMVPEQQYSYPIYPPPISNGHDPHMQPTPIPPPHHISPLPLQQIPPQPPEPIQIDPKSDSSPAQTGSGAARPLIRPPGDVDCCIACGIRESPEWRRSENGVKELCNACGLRLARQVAKREGKQKPRKKKEK